MSRDATEHLIRLRGGWTAAPSEPVSPESSAFVSLPILWESLGPSPSELRRPFGRPPHDPETTRLALRWSDAPGLASLVLNGRPLLSGPIPDSGEVNLAGRLNARNVLEVGLDAASVAEEDRVRPWGCFALVLAAKG